jgi:hypothetical protein
VRHVILAALVAALAACGSPAASYPATPAPPPTSSTSVPLVGTPAPNAAASTATCHARGELPDPVCTPGVTDARVTQDTIRTTICVKGYTKGVRPVSSYTDDLKRVQILEYGYADHRPMSYEEDHLIPLELGGDPSDRRNLWPQPWPENPRPNRKDGVENRLHQLVCSGALPLAVAQNAIAADWTDALVRYGTSPRP